MRPHPESVDGPADHPALLVVDDTSDELDGVARALERRFGAEYPVIALGSAAAATAALEQLARDGKAVALAAVGLRDIARAVELLRRAHALHPGAAARCSSRWRHAAGTGPRTDPILRASALGEIDLTILKGWVSPEEWLYPQIQEALSAWANAHRPRHEHVRLVGEQWSPR